MGDTTYNDLGVHGGCRVRHVICEMGSGGPEASQQRTSDAIQHWAPRAVVAVGIAFGLHEEKQKIGDVLVSTQLEDYGPGKSTKDGSVIGRADRPSTRDPLKGLLRTVDSHRTGSSEWPSVHFGLVLSGPRLVDNLAFCDELRRRFPEAVGGEMEGSGVYAAAVAGRVDWIVIKAICDWGHGKDNPDKDAHQKLAACNAALVLKAALDAGALYECPSANGAAGGASPRPR